MDTRNKSGKHLNLFGLIFVAIGLGFGSFMIGGAVLDHLEARSWVPVEATVLTTRLNVSRSNDSTTYRVSATYRYRFNGQDYTGRRVGLYGGSDNLGRYHRDWHQRLENARSAGRTVTAWVNPADPNEALLDRELRWSFLGFIAVFVGSSLSSSVRRALAQEVSQSCVIGVPSYAGPRLARHGRAPVSSQRSNLSPACCAEAFAHCA